MATKPRSSIGLSRAKLWERHYRQIGVVPGWDEARVRKACRLLGETIEELAASCAVPPSRVMTWLKGFNMIPSYVSLLFFMREQHFLRTRFGEDTEK